MAHSARQACTSPVLPLVKARRGDGVALSDGVAHCVIVILCVVVLDVWEMRCDGKGRGGGDGEAKVLAVLPGLDGQTSGDTLVRRHNFLCAMQTPATGCDIMLLPFPMNQIRHRTGAWGGSR